MDPIVVNPELSTRLHGLDRQVAFVDDNGEPLGMFIPMSSYRQWLASVEIPFSQEEIERWRAEKGGSSLKEFWARMEQP